MQAAADYFSRILSPPPARPRSQQQQPPQPQRRDRDEPTQQQPARSGTPSSSAHTSSTGVLVSPHPPPTSSPSPPPSSLSLSLSAPHPAPTDDYLLARLESRVRELEALLAEAPDPRELEGLRARLDECEGEMEEGRARGERDGERIANLVRRCSCPLSLSLSPAMVCGECAGQGTN